MWSVDEIPVGIPDGRFFALSAFFVVHVRVSAVQSAAAGSGEQC